MRKTLLSGAAALFIVLAIAWPANAESTDAAAPSAGPDDVAFLAAMQELGVTSEQFCCDAVCGGGGLTDLNRCMICCPPPATTPHCYCNDGEAVCQCNIIPDA